MTLIYPYAERISSDKVIQFHSQDGVTVRAKFVDLFDVKSSLEHITSDFIGSRNDE